MEEQELFFLLKHVCKVHAWKESTETAGGPGSYVIGPCCGSSSP